MIIYAEGWDADTSRTSTPYYPLVINTKDVLYARGSDGKGNMTTVCLRYNITKETGDGTRSEPIWVVLNMPIKEFYEKWKGSEVTE